VLRLLRTSLNNHGAPGAGRATLDQLAPGTRGRLVALGGARLFRRRLMELGLLPGTTVRVVRVATLNGLLEVEARGSLVSLRLADASGLEVEPSGDGGDPSVEATR
jgi:Fe2+ transport system protein FeoA